VASLGTALIAEEKAAQIKADLKGAEMLETKIISQLQKIAGKKAVLTSKEDLNAYSYDGTATWAHMPDVVVLPTTAAQVASESGAPQVEVVATDSRVKGYCG
jgi:hypothetical protein